MKLFWWNKKISIIQAAISVKNILIYLYVCLFLSFVSLLILNKSGEGYYTKKKTNIVENCEKNKTLKSE